MELEKNQIARVSAKDVKSLFLASDRTKKTMQDYIEGREDQYSYKVDINYDELYYDIFLYKKDISE